MTTGEREQRAALRAAWRAKGWYPDLTIGEALAAGALGRPDDTLTFAAVDAAAITLTLAELHRATIETAGRLSGAGVRAGDAVVVQAPADLVGTEVVAALWSLGAIVVPLPVTATPDEVGHAVAETGAATVIAIPEWRGTDLVSWLAASGVARVVTLGDRGPEGTVPLSSLSPAPFPVPPHDPSADACVLYTSGSTAAPKGVRHTHETLLFGITAVPADAATRTLATFPAGHVASVMGLLRPLAMGGTTVVMDRWSARAAAALIEEHRITASAGTPFFLSTLLDEAERSGRDISSLRRFLCGAATVPPALVARAEAAGIISWRTYGSTEHPAISSGGPDDPADKRRLTDGRPSWGNEVRLVDEAGADVAPGEEGEIVARGPKQFVGYQNPAADEGAYVDGTWFRTGDLARFDPDGYVVVTDRVKDIVIRGGENISAREVEEALADHPGVADVAVCAAPDDVWGEAVCAFVVARDPAAPPSLASLSAHGAARGLAAHKLPARVVVVEDMPRTAAGKIRKRDLRTQLESPARR